MQNLSTADFTCIVRFFIIVEDITKFFPSSSKKRDPNDTSKTDEDPKKIREASSQSFADEVDVLIKVLIRRLIERFYSIDKEP